VILRLTITVMNLYYPQDLSKEIVFAKVSLYISSLGLNIMNSDETRPWGGFLVIDEDQADKFIEIFFDSADQEGIDADQKLSPKILIVEPHKKLSWQYHHRRSELWKVIGGPAAVVKSDTNEEKEKFTYDTGTVIQLAQGERHRLVGLDNWGIIAEIWQHTDPEDPSDEDDIVRIQDDFGR